MEMKTRKSAEAVAALNGHGPLRFDPQFVDGELKKLELVDLVGEMVAAIESPGLYDGRLRVLVPKRPPSWRVKLGDIVDRTFDSREEADEFADRLNGSWTDDEFAEVEEVEG